MSKQDRTANTPLSELASVVLGYIGTYPDGVHGYHLGRMLSRSPLGLPSLRLGQLYRILRHLERAGLVRSHIEVAGPRPARYRFVTTPGGRSAFRQWLASLPHGRVPVREQVLNRLRFSDRLPISALQRLLEEAVRACQTELETLRRHETPGGDPAAEPRPLHCMAVEARLLADRRWLDELQLLIEESLRCADVSAASGQGRASA